MIEFLRRTHVEICEPLIHFSPSQAIVCLQLTMATVATKTLISSSPMKWAVGGWSFFIVENFILSENRTYLINNLGDEGYHAAYGTLSTVAMGSVFYGYFRKVKNSQPLLWSISSAAPFHAKIASFVCLSIGLGMASQIPPKIQIPVHFVSNTSKNINTETSDISEQGALNTSAEIAEQKRFQIRCPFVSRKLSLLFLCSSFTKTHNCFPYRISRTIKIQTVLFMD